MSRKTLRMRVFAGPNGSGKSTVIQKVRTETVNGSSIDFGIYINADDIARSLVENTFSFNDYTITTRKKEFDEIAAMSGLIDHIFTREIYNNSFSLRTNHIRLKDINAKDKLAQIIADFLRRKLLQEEKKFSFETVFSHTSKLDIMRDAVYAGYKVYLYFVSTESPDINVYRVLARKNKGGHDVPEDRIRSRYIRSLDMLYDASQLAYQAFYFDNSVDGTEAAMFAHFKKSVDKKIWDEIDETNVPVWFKTYYSGKIP